MSRVTQKNETTIRWVIDIFVVYMNDINPSIKVPDKGLPQIPLIAPENKMLDGL